MGNSFGCSASGERLVSAARDGDLVEAKMLLDCNPYRAKYSCFGGLKSPLHFAAVKGHKDIFALLLENGADVNSRNYCGQIPALGGCADPFALQMQFAYGEFCGQVCCEEWNSHGPFETMDPPNKPEERLSVLQEPLEQGLTIIYVPTRKETLSIAKYLCKFGVKAAAYNASLPKSHLRQVHKEFHENSLQVVVATMAFGMGIDKLNVQRIIHYGWPQSLEAYYQEAGRAGRDGKLADCILYANLSRVPTLLPSKRSEAQAKRAYKMLSDFFRLREQIILVEELLYILLR